MAENFRGDMGGCGSTYPWDGWLPLGVPLVGEYADYGGFDYEGEDPYRDLLYRSLCERWLTVERDWNTAEPGELLLVDNLEVPKDFWAMCRDLEHGDARLDWKRYCGEKRRSKVGYMAIHYPIYEALTEASLDQKAYGLWGYDMGFPTERARLDGMMRKFLMRKKRPDSWDPLIMNSPIKDVSWLGEWHPPSLDLWEVMQCVKRAKTAELQTSLSTRLMQFLALYDVMQSMRKRFIPQCGCGSQHVEIAQHRLMMAEMGKILDHEEAERVRWEADIWGGGDEEA